MPVPKSGRGGQKEVVSWNTTTDDLFLVDTMDCAMIFRNTTTRVHYHRNIVHQEDFHPCHYLAKGYQHYGCIALLSSSFYPLWWRQQQSLLLQQLTTAQRIAIHGHCLPDGLIIHQRDYLTNGPSRGLSIWFTHLE